MERHTSLSNDSRVENKNEVRQQCPGRLAAAPVSLSPLSSGQPPCVGTLLPSGQCGEEWPCDQVLAKERSKTLLKRLQGGGGERSSHSLAHRALQSAGRTSPQAGALAPFPPTHPIMPDHLDSLLTLKDYKGQTLTEHMFQDLTLFYGTWIYLWVCGSTVWVGYIIMAGFALLHLLMFPSWPIYRRHPLKGLPV